MRIALTTNFSPWSPYSGGGQRSTHQLASALALRGHDVTVVYTKAPLDRIVEPGTICHIRFVGRLVLVLQGRRH